jgi:hypothetical protein
VDGALALTAIALPSEDVSVLAAGDLNGDGISDLAVKFSSYQELAFDCAAFVLNEH